MNGISRKLKQLKDESDKRTGEGPELPSIQAGRTAFWMVLEEAIAM
jgi:hypothetical protein